MSTGVAVGASSELSEQVLEILRRSPEPLGLRQLAKHLDKPYKNDPELLGPVVEQLQSEGTLHRYASFRRSGPRYSTATPQEYVATKLVEILSSGPRTRSELAKRVTTLFGGISKDLWTKVLNGQIRDGRLHELQAALGTRSKWISARPPSAPDYLNAAVDKLCERLATVGITRSHILGAARELVRSELGDSHEVSNAAIAEAAKAPAPAAISLQNLILERMSVIEPRAAEGAMVSIPQLRQSVDFHGSPAEFDAALLELGRTARVDLHRHDFAAGLTEDERAAMITDAEGRVYNTVSRNTAT